MKIVLVTSSPQKNGNSAVLARQALIAANRMGADTSEIYLPEYNIIHCNGCFHCTSKGYCPIQDDCGKLKAELQSSDGIIFSSPTYGFEPCSGMRNFNDERMGMYETYTSSMAGKYYLGFSTAGGVGARKVAKKLAYSKMSNIFARSYVSGYHGALRSGKNFEIRRIEECDSDMHRAYQLGIKLVYDISKNRRYHFQGLVQRIMNKLILKPIITKNIKKNREGIMRGVYLNLVDRKLF